MERNVTVERSTLETQIQITLDLDTAQQSDIVTPVPFLNHMLEQVARHGHMQLTVRASGDVAIDDHHTVEDIGISFGQAISRALGKKEGITRYGFAYAPLDEALTRVVLDISGRPGLFYDVHFTRARVGAFDLDLLREFFTGFVNHAGVTLHIDLLKGINSHHQAESMFKAFALALRQAVRKDSSAKNAPSTKGCL